MQTHLDLHLLIYILLAVLCSGALICIYNITRPRGIHGAFVNGEGANLDMTEAEIRAEDISGAFNNADYAVQTHKKAKIGREASGSGNSAEVQEIKNVLSLLIAYLFGEKYPPNYKGKNT
ncbi:uncharacterized protein LOC114189764 isoform X2 [Vigna unguiculata]|uniref:uncharacterized protein LOC114189764 isoform X2 n=1 Tax=Vigna unguiculata TaxID=3917 RepID=UPI0010160F61|nr:uncharacterized protein LOC114189764 isoform X2 [Vigna unguiculata]